MSRAVRITRQFREQQNATYELDCSGLPLAIRIFAPVDDSTTSAWRVEMSGADVVISASAASRALAFDLMIERWGGSDASGAYKALDWQAIRSALGISRAY